MMEQATMPEAQAAMSARLRITESDYLSAMALAARFTRRQQAILFLSMAFGVGMFGVVLMITTGVISGPSVDIAGVGVMVGIVGVAGVAGRLITVWLIRPWTLRYQSRQYKALAMHDEYVITLRVDGVRFALAGGESLLPWSKILKWRCNADCVLIYLMPYSFSIIPMRMAEQGFDMERLKAALAQHVGLAEWGR